MRLDPDVTIELLQEERDEARAEVERLKQSADFQRASALGTCSELAKTVERLRAALEVFAEESNWREPPHPEWENTEWIGEADKPWIIAQEAL